MTARPAPQRWAERRDALRGQLSCALTLAAQKLELTVQPSRWLHLVAYYDLKLTTKPQLAEVRKSVRDKLFYGPVQI